MENSKTEKSYEWFWHIILIVAYSLLILNFWFGDKKTDIEFYQDFIKTMAQANLTISVGLGAIIVALVAIVFPTQERNDKRKSVIQRNDVRRTLHLFLAFLTTNLLALMLSFAHAPLELVVILTILAVIPYLALTSFAYKLIKILHSLI